MEDKAKEDNQTAMAMPFAPTPTTGPGQVLFSTLPLGTMPQSQSSGAEMPMPTTTDFSQLNLNTPGWGQMNPNGFQAG